MRVAHAQRFSITTIDSFAQHQVFDAPIMPSDTSPHRRSQYRWRTRDILISRHTPYECRHRVRARGRILVSIERKVSIRQYHVIILQYLLELYLYLVGMQTH